MEREEFEEITKKLKEGDEILVLGFLSGTRELTSRRVIFDRTFGGWIHLKQGPSLPATLAYHYSSIESITKSETLKKQEKRSRKDTIIGAVIACIIVGALILIPLSLMGWAIWGWLASILPSWIPAPIGILLGIIIAILICYLLLALTGGK